MGKSKYMKKTLLFLINICAAMFITVNGYADTTIYGCKDADGETLHFTNVPAPGRKCRIIFREKTETDVYPMRQKTVKNIRLPADKIIFVDEKINKIDNSTAGLKKFYDAIEQARNNALQKIIIYHLGDSHVSASTFPKQIEALLQDELLIKNNSVPAEKSANLNYYAFGSSGRTIEFFAASEHMANSVASLKPHLIIITLGTNDAFARLSYEGAMARLKRLTAIMQSASPQSSILFTLPADCFYQGKNTNPYIGIIRRAFIDFCNRNRCAFWDLYQIMGGTQSMESWMSKGLSSADGVHFTEAGYAYQGSLLVGALKKGYLQYLQWAK